MTNRVKVGLIGLGNIGRNHAGYLKTLGNVELVGVCDVVKAKADQFAAQCRTTAYYDYRELFDQSGLEAVIIAVPHYSHTPISIEAFDRGLHVLCEKPLAVHVNDAQKSIDAYERAKAANPNIVFGLMFMERTYSYYKKIKEFIESGELGRLTRATWINTAWFRTQAYYDSGDWRATWAGEGGGILTNQCPHNLDMYQWLFGVPAKVSGHANIGKYHDIEVEDEVSAFFQHDNGMVGHFIVTTAESPGTNRLEIVGENGKLVYEEDKLVFYRNRVSMLKYLKEAKAGFGKMENWKIDIPYGGGKDSTKPHQLVTERFIEVIQNGGKLIAHGTEGIRSVAIANAIMLSSFTQSMVDLPFDGDLFESKLKELIKTSRYVKNTRDDVEADISKSYSR